MTLSEIRRRIHALMRRFARELAILKLRRIAESVSDEWDPSDPPEPNKVIARVANARFHLPTFMALRRYLDDVRRRQDVPDAEEFVVALLPWASHDRYSNFFRWDLPPAQTH